MTGCDVSDGEINTLWQNPLLRRRGATSDIAAVGMLFLSVLFGA
jgi:hypothetical protein